MKKLYFLLVTMLVALAANASKVYYDNSETNWANVYAYVWGGDVSGQSNWPGDAMTYNQVTMMWEIEFNGTPANIIFNNNSGTQTGDLVFEDGATYDKNGVKGVELNTYTVIFDNTKSGWENVYAYYWGGGAANGWPGDLMTKGEDNLWTLEIKAVSAPANIIFNNNKGTQTADLTFEDGVTYDKDGKVTDEPVVKETFSASYNNGKTQWETVYAYCWKDGKDGETAWPGVEMTLEEGTIYTVTFELVDAPDFIIFNNGNGAQTEDLEFVDGQEYGEDAEEEDPEEPVEAVTIRLTGNNMQAGTIDIDGTTYNTFDGKEGTDAEGYQIVLMTSGKTYSASGNVTVDGTKIKCIKGTSNADNIIYIPEGLVATKLTVIGYINSTSAEGYISSVNGVEYENDWEQNKAVNTKVYELETPASVITFHNSGTQFCAIFDVEVVPDEGGEEDPEEAFEPYSITSAPTNADVYEGYDYVRTNELINIDVTSTTITLNKFLGGNSNNIKLVFNADEEIEALYLNDEEVELGSYGYPIYTGDPELYYAYIDPSYSAAYADEEGGYVSLYLYAYDTAYNTHEMYYNMEWTVGQTNPAYMDWYYNIVGPFNEWNCEGVHPTPDGYATLTLSDMGIEGFKVKIWDGEADHYYNNGQRLVAGEEISVEDNLDDIMMKLPMGYYRGDVTLTYDLLENTIKVEKRDDLDYTGWYLKVPGEYNGWDQYNGIELNAMNNYSAFAEIKNFEGEFKVMVWDGAENFWLSNGEELELDTEYVLTGDKGNMYLSEDYNGYTIYVNFDVKTMTLMVEGVAPIEGFKVYFDNSLVGFIMPTVVCYDENQQMLDLGVIPMEQCAETPEWMLQQIAQYHALSNQVWDYNTFEATVPTKTAYVMFIDYADDEADFSNMHEAVADHVYSMTDDLGSYDVVVTGVEAIAAENEAPVYFNLQGQRVERPANGIFIRVAEGKVSKVLVK